MLTRFLAGEDGAVLVEYLLMVLLIAVFALTAVQAFGLSLTDLWQDIANKAGTAMGGS